MNIEVMGTHDRVDDLIERINTLEGRIALLEQVPTGWRGWVHRLIYGSR